MTIKDAFQILFAGAAMAGFMFAVIFFAAVLT